MPEKPLHIVSFDNPYPPVYGGAIDVFYKIKALHQQGFAIHLHCYTDQIPQEFSPLKQFVHALYFYQRQKKGQKLLALSPFSVASRYSQELVQNIEKVEAPILFEGLQSTYLLHKHVFADRKKFLRLLNLESNYFGGLCKSERQPVKKLLFGIESLKYAWYQKIMGRFDAVFSLSHFETGYVSKRFGNAHYIPVFHGNTEVANLSGFGKYALYHGDLRMSDNRRAALFLIEVFRQIPNYPLVIASNRGKRRIKKIIKSIPNISHTPIDSHEHLEQLLREAHMSVMLSFQQSGTKLKSVNSLYKTRHCIINGNMIDDEKIRQLCTMAETQADFIAAINRLKAQPYHDFEMRKIVLGSVLNDEVNAQKISMIIKNQNP